MSYAQAWPKPYNMQLPKTVYTAYVHCENKQVNKPRNLCSKNKESSGQRVAETQ
jgi:hypothetical protein